MIEEAVRAALGGERAWLVGHGWGAWAGFFLCLQAPQRVRGYLAPTRRGSRDVLPGPLLTQIEGEPVEGDPVVPAHPPVGLGRVAWRIDEVIQLACVAAPLRPSENAPMQTRSHAA